jgi:hypothetical protein|tara:strand:+ start:73 stop:243 length:171 start_codon:yes stop_codon:yes gene_type:complete
LEYAKAKATSSDIPEFPVHDEVVIPTQHKGLVGGYMMNAFHALTNNHLKDHVAKIT